MYTTSTQHRAVKLQMPFMSSFSMNIISGSCKLSFTEITHFYYIYSSAFLFMFDIPVSLFARLLYLSTLKKCSYSAFQGREVYSSQYKRRNEIPIRRGNSRGIKFLEQATVLEKILDQRLRSMHMVAYGIYAWLVYNGCILKNRDLYSCVYI